MKGAIMVQLNPMIDQEYEDFMVISMKDQAEGQVQDGEWSAEEAQGNIEKLQSEFLPNELATPNHFFFMIMEPASGSNVGGLWYLMVEEAGKRQFLVLDIQIYDDYRRNGYGSQAFQTMEEKGREMGVTKISLHVFKHNHSARAMYEKLGYFGFLGSDTNMFKDL
jgi:GNAT superfamily N-acetyltransferase